MELIHWSHKPVTEVRSVKQAIGEEVIAHKPLGFWVSIGDGEDGWRQWCESENFNLATLRNKHIVMLSEGANILRLSNAADILDFTKQYEALREWQKTNSLDRRGHHLNWQKVAEEYDGIIIAPYVWECRLNQRCTWYYTWDVASGCIWNAAAVASISVTEVREEIAA